MTLVTLIIILRLLISPTLTLAFVTAPFAFTRYQQQHLGHVLSSSLFSMNQDDHSMEEEFREKIAEQDDPYNVLFAQEEWSHRPKPESVYIILFKPDTEDEGVHTIEIPQGSGNNVILAFETLYDCCKFAGILKSRQFFDPKPQQMVLKNLETYCDTLGILVKVVPNGMQLIPPAETVEELGHNPNLGDEKKYIDHVFSISDSDVGDEGALMTDNAGDSWA